MIGKSKRQQEIIASTRTTGNVYTPDRTRLLNSIPNLLNQLDPEQETGGGGGGGVVGEPNLWHSMGAVNDWRYVNYTTNFINSILIIMEP